MRDQSSRSDRMAEVGRLTAALTDQILDAQVMKRPVAAGQVQALAKAARLLHENGLPWPRMLSQVLHELTDSVEADVPEEKLSVANGGGDSIVEGLTRFIKAFRNEHG